MRRFSYHALFAIFSMSSLAFLMILGPRILAAQKGKSLGEKEVLELLEGGVSSRRVSELVNDRGIDFDLTPEIEERVRSAGGGDDVIASLKRESRRHAETLSSRKGGIPIAGIKPPTVQFYEGLPDPVLEQSKRIYQFSFDRFSARSVFWELDLSFPPPGRRIDFQVEAVWYKPDGSEMTRQTLPAHVDPDWGSSWHTLGYGWVEGGHWIPGTYRVDFYSGNQRVATGTFQIN